MGGAVTRAAKIAEAQRLHSKGLSYPKIGKRFGVSRSTAYKWVNPEWAREHNRRSNAKRNDAKRAWDREHYRADCVDCGAEICGQSTRCRDCEDFEKRRQRHELVRLWNDGLTLREIAARLDSTINSVGVMIARLRKNGAYLPYRYANATNHRYDLPVEPAA